MDKFAEQINRDIYALAMYKLANWSKLAEGEPVSPPPPQQEPEPYPTNIREMDPRRAAEALKFEHDYTGPMMYPDIGGENGAPTIRSTMSPVTQREQSMPQRFAETGMEAASGMQLPKPSPDDVTGLNHPGLSMPLRTQFWNLERDPYGQGFYDDIRKHLDPSINYSTRPIDPGAALRQQQNFYPRQQPRQ